MLDSVANTEKEHPTQVFNELERLSKSVEQLGAVIETLDLRLVPVSFPIEVPKVGEDPAVQEALCPVAERIQASRVVIQSAITELKEITNRLEI